MSTLTQAILVNINIIWKCGEKKNVNHNNNDRENIGAYLFGRVGVDESPLVLKPLIAVTGGCFNMARVSQMSQSFMWNSLCLE